MQQPKILSERAQKVLACAESLFLKHGYQGTSLQMLIKQAGGSRRTIYAEFGNKEELFKAVLQQKIGEVHLILSTVDRAKSPQQNLTKVCESFLTKLLQPDMLTLFRLLIPTAQTLPEIGEMLNQHELIIGPQGLADYLQQLHNQGLIQLEDAQQASHLLLGMVKGYLHIHAMLNPNFVASSQQIKQHVSQSIQVFLHGVAAPIAKPRVKVPFSLLIINRSTE